MQLEEMGVVNSDGRLSTDSRWCTAAVIAPRRSEKNFLPLHITNSIAKLLNGVERRKVEVDAEESPCRVFPTWRRGDSSCGGTDCLTRRSSLGCFI